MENAGDHCWEQESIVNELMQGRELARQLQVHLNVPSSSQEARELLVQKILTSYEKALSMLNSDSSVASRGEPIQPAGVAPRAGTECPASPRSGSPRSEDSDRDLKDQEFKDTAKKRRTLPRWTKQVRVTPGTAVEVPLDDGFSWRKYGQKDILGARHPRGYYRCTHRNVQGCLATKQVQRSDDDPTIFEITYRGRHTCTQASHSQMRPSSSSAAPSENQEQERDQNNQQQLQDNLLLTFQKGLKVITEDLGLIHEQQAYPSFAFPSTSNVKAESSTVFSPAMMENYSPSFISPAASGTNFFSVSQTGVPGNLNFQSSESQIAGVISAVTSATNSPTVGLDFPFPNVEFDPNFSFEDPGYFL